MDHPDRFRVQVREPVRLDRYLTGRLPGVSRTRIQRHIERGDVLVDGKTVRPSHLLHGGETLSLPPLRRRRLEVTSARLPLSIVYEDADLIVVDKPAGMLVHPVGREFGATLLNAVYRHIADAGEPADEVGIVHRLDRGTSGLVVVAKRLQARRALGAQAESHAMHRGYLAVVQGTPPARSGRLDLPIRRDPSRPTRMQVVTDPGDRGVPARSHVSSSGYSDPRRDLRPRHARTHYRLVRRLRGAALVAAELETGRTHQIRVHFQAAGFPILGDPLYGPVDEKGAVEPDFLQRPALHAARLTLRHPTLDVVQSFRAPLPQDMRRLVLHLGDGSRGDSA